jgi:hypothetical protein
MAHRLLKFLMLVGLCFGLSAMALAKPVPPCCEMMAAHTAQAGQDTSSSMDKSGCPPSKCMAMQCLAAAPCVATLSANDAGQAITRYTVREKKSRPALAVHLNGRASAPELKPPTFA